ncbi:hypothetical protein [Siphonobacter sp. SORGH_AS_1065]|uniref:hypothetical protein n=1 Tax=Siphonobacter sp. SORGH_AS_1065 TaxID=3041795 RepID=UPI00278ADAE6|nr:hypothetical protein [Siphonobacter sp. SORGH_AS_1065]MDQ1088561.1 hypothetical protein [Siphonobacter sp. SORGH_AS_1065]
MEVNPDVFDALQAEKQELDILIENGVKFKTPIRSWLRLLSKTKERTFIIQQPYLGTLDYITAEYIRMDFSEERIKEDPLGESKRLALVNAKRCAHIIALCILNSKLKIALFSGVLTQYLLWRITPSKLFQIALLINTMSNIADFTNSIRLMSTNPRTTAPDLIEKKEPKA